jgi:hypothetical protein
VINALRGKALVNTNVGSEAEDVMASSTDHGAVREMEVVWPSGTGLRKQVPNRHEGRWLKTVVLSVVGKGAAVIASGMDREDERWTLSSLSLTCRNRVR